MVRRACRLSYRCGGIYNIMARETPNSPCEENQRPANRAERHALVVTFTIHSLLTDESRKIRDNLSYQLYGARRGWQQLIRSARTA
jgi:hypothetical protein